MPTIGVFLSRLESRSDFNIVRSSQRAPGHPASADQGLGLARQNDRVKKLPASELLYLPAAASLQGRLQILVKSESF
jgi:hypothetical protein